MNDRVATWAEAFKAADGGMGRRCGGCGRLAPETNSDERCGYCALSRALAAPFGGERFVRTGSVAL
jgi:hypothetical protein